MLRSTGFFRGIDCPFYPENSEGKGGRNGCNRPYCHFRHSQQRRPSYGSPAAAAAAAAEGPKKGDLHPGKKGAQFPSRESSRRLGCRSSRCGGKSWPQRNAPHFPQHVTYPPQTTEEVSKQQT